MVVRNKFSKRAMGGLITDPTKENPKFKTQAEHFAHYRNIVATRMQTENPELYTEYLDAVGRNDIDKADSFILAIGGIPAWVPPDVAPRQPQTTQLPDFQAPKNTGGYRYSAGHGKPAKGSITRRRFDNGGLITDPNDPTGLKKLLESPPSPEMDSFMNRIEPWKNPDREWFGGDTALGEGQDLYIDDAGNLKKKPIPYTPNPLLALPQVQQSSTFVDRSQMSFKAKTPKKPTTNFEQVANTF